MPAKGPTTAIRGTGNAPIVKTGHTANNQHASDPNAKVKGRAATRELSTK